MVVLRPPLATVPADYPIDLGPRTLETPGTRSVTGVTAASSRRHAGMRGAGTPTAATIAAAAWRSA